MANYVVFFAGSGQKVKDDKHVYNSWGKGLWESDGKYIGIYNDGVGEAEGTSGTTGAGWAKAIESSMNGIPSAPQKVIVVGMSRGGVQAVIFAHCVKDKFPATEVFVFAVDPVDGGHIQNEGSFDLRDNRNLMARVTTGLGFARGTRGDLKKKYNLQDDAPKTIPTNVKFYLSVLAQFKGNTRAFWGFTPQAPELGNLTCTVPHQTYELPGDHGYGVYTGNEKKKKGIYGFRTKVDVYDPSREARGKVTREMFSYHLRERGFTQNFSVGFDLMQAMEYYCQIAMEDLSGSQGQGNKNRSGFSFLEASRRAGTNWGDSFNASPENRWHKGRGHLIKSTEAIRGKGYFVNSRHRQIYIELESRLQAIFLSQGTATDGATAMQLKHSYPNILPWMLKNAEFARDREADKTSFVEFIQLLETLF